MAVEPDIEAWAQAVKARMRERSVSQSELGEAVARVAGRQAVYAQGSIGDWLRAGPPKAHHAIWIEEALDAPVGSLTQYLGFVSVEARPAVNFDDVVDRDGRLTDEARRLLKGMYAQARKG